jgi:hypothetical protein
MGKNSRQHHRQSTRSAEAAVRVRAAHRRRWLPYRIGGAIVILGIIVALGVMALGNGGGSLPAGTKVFSEKAHAHVIGVVHYDHVPPAGGDHNAAWMNCGVYLATVPNENAVHSLEHGAVWITYRPGLTAQGITQLQTFVRTHLDGVQGYLLLSPYTGLPSPVVASAWGAQIRLNGPRDPRLSAFVTHFIGGAQGGEPGAPCTGGVGSPA